MKLDTPHVRRQCAVSSTPADTKDDPKEEMEVYLKEAVERGYRDLTDAYDSEYAELLGPRLILVRCRDKPPHQVIEFAPLQPAQGKPSLSYWGFNVVETVQARLPERGRRASSRTSC